MGNVSHPKHYNQGKIEVIEFIEDKNLDFCLANTVKYICRAGIKDVSKEIEDLEKAAWYLARKIERLKAAKEGRPVVRPNDMNPAPSSIEPQQLELQLLLSCPSCGSTDSIIYRRPSTPFGKGDYFCPTCRHTWEGRGK